MVGKGTLSIINKEPEFTTKHSEELAKELKASFTANIVTVDTSVSAVVSTPLLAVPPSSWISVSVTTRSATVGSSLLFWYVIPSIAVAIVDAEPVPLVNVTVWAEVAAPGATNPRSSAFHMSAHGLLDTYDSIGAVSGQVLLNGGFNCNWKGDFTPEACNYSIRLN